MASTQPVKLGQAAPPHDGAPAEHLTVPFAEDVPDGDPDDEWDAIYTYNPPPPVRSYQVSVVFVRGGRVQPTRIDHEFDEDGE